MARSDRGLTPQQEAFAAGIASGLSQADAYRKAYPASVKWRDESVYSKSSGLAADAKVRKRVADLLSTAAEAAQVDVNEVVRWLTDVLRADPRELVQVKTGCCRHCWGEGHRYQRTVGEMNADRELWAEKGKKLEEFDEQGGIGYDALQAPNPECPECGGDGLARTVLADTRRISRQAAALYAGAKQTKYGIEILMHSKADVAEKLMKFLGAYERDNAQQNPLGGFSPDRFFADIFRKPQSPE
jgi:hypothetical protein